MTRARSFLTFALCLVPFALTGCGYALAGKGSFLPDYIVYSGARDTDGSNHALCAGFWGEEWKTEAKVSP